MKVSVLTPTIRGLQALRPVEQSLKAQAFGSFEWLIEYGDGKTHDLSAAYNNMLRRARGELVVSAQDWLWFGPDGLQKFWDAYQSKPGYFFTAPVPKAPSLAVVGEQFLYRGDLEHEWRSKEPGECLWPNWEIDWAAAPLQAFKDIGGFDEYFDGAFGNDNTSVSYRAMLAGWKFWAIADNPAVALKHDGLFAHPFRHLHNPARNAARYAEYDRGLKLKL
jgi:hypothetical protein